MRIIENSLLKILPLELGRIDIAHEQPTIEAMNNDILFERQKRGSLTICR